jgi:hypothetical protein
VTRRDEDDHDKISAHGYFDAGGVINFILPLPQALPLKLDFGLGTPKREVALSNALVRTGGHMIPAPDCHISPGSK